MILSNFQIEKVLNIKLMLYLSIASQPKFIELDELLTKRSLKRQSKGKGFQYHYEYLIDQQKESGIVLRLTPLDEQVIEIYNYDETLAKLISDVIMIYDAKHTIQDDKIETTIKEIEFSVKIEPTRKKIVNVRTHSTAGRNFSLNIGRIINNNQVNIDIVLDNNYIFTREIELKTIPKNEYREILENYVDIDIV